ncbi:MAG: hypothetical protein JO060_11055 [Candidatus Eremiobacteraeota bacterium]|nr:hypothetical protein [Candidatus Eremiobacteraeota bacterium]MBV9646771.1 hypothetical protein [Candidatus Eremiobacteraeota bacterium]
MLTAAFAMLLMLVPAPVSTITPPTAQIAHHDRRHAPRASRTPERWVVAGIRPGDLYAARAKRRIASYLRMRLLELRLRSLDRAAAVVEHRLSLEELLHSP